MAVTHKDYYKTIPIYIKSEKKWYTHEAVYVNIHIHVYKSETWKCSCEHSHAFIMPLLFVECGRALSVAHVRPSVCPSVRPSVRPSFR